MLCCKNMRKSFFFLQYRILLLIFPTLNRRSQISRWMGVVDEHPGLGSDKQCLGEWVLLRSENGIGSKKSQQFPYKWTKKMPHRLCFVCGSMNNNRILAKLCAEWHVFRTNIVQICVLVAIWPSYSSKCDIQSFDHIPTPQHIQKHDLWTGYCPKHPLCF